MDNRSTILANALQLFASRGYDAVGVQEIVEASGVTKPTLYHYFGSKRGLLDALLEKHFTPLVQAVAQAAEYRGDLPLTLEKIARAFFDYARGHRAFYRMQLALWYTPQQSEAFQAVAPWNEKSYLVIEQMFLQAASQHGNMKGRQRAYATTFLGMINTYIGMALNGYTELEDPLVYQAVHQFMHGIFS
ncbi:MAG: TetR/AcrR family transcriptional regulator [Chloroflexota bacterium]